MGWLVFLLVLAVLAATSVVVSVNRLRFERNVAKEQGALLVSALSPPPLQGVRALPPPAARYKELAVGNHAPVRALRMRHGGTFCMSPGAKPVPIRGTQVFTADPPGFVWMGRVHVAPGVWIDARDMAIAGKGNMRVLLDDTLPIADARGESIDQAATVRLLTEMPWFPTALFDERYVEWSAIDEDHARATLRLGDQEVSAVFEFGADGLPARAITERFTDQGKLRPWGGTYGAYRSVSGMLVPFEAQVTWQLEAGPFTYAHWLVETMEFQGAAAPSSEGGSGGLPRRADASA
jgi:hypothetical protein